jgi:hypothetical protein
MLAEIVWVPMGLRRNIESGKDAKMVKHSIKHRSNWFIL